MLTIGEFARIGQVSPRMLRHYDEIGLLRPDRVDPGNGYRLYGSAQLGDLHRLLALRDLGFTLDQIRNLLTEAPGPEEIRGMLKVRRAQVEQLVETEQARLRRIEAHLRSLEGSYLMDPKQLDVVIKQTNPLRVAEGTGVVSDFGSGNIGPVFEEVIPIVLARLGEAGITPAMMVGHYDYEDQPADDAPVVVHAGFDIGDHELESTDTVAVVDLPIIEVASVVHRGPMETVNPVYEALIRWIEDSGYTLAGRSRELYLEWDECHQEKAVTELQMPIG